MRRERMNTVQKRKGSIPYLCWLSKRDVADNWRAVILLGRQDNAKRAHEHRAKKERKYPLPMLDIEWLSKRDVADNWRAVILLGRHKTSW
jgi:hypothetical protein